MCCSACHHVTLLLFLSLLSLGTQNGQLGSVVGCHKVEREALFKFKHSLTDLENRLSSWEGEDCCTWQGVGCDNVTSYVNHLDLHNSYCDPYFNGFKASLFLTSPKLDPSLLVLSHLKYLDLSCNDFQGSRIPGFIGSFKHLRHLNLSSSNFGGIVPSQLGNLTRLHILDLSMDHMSSIPLLGTDLHWASTLVNLQYMNLSGIFISLMNNSMNTLSMPSLLSLRLYNCDLSIPDFRSLFSNSTWLSRIQDLDLRDNPLEGSLPFVFANMTSLTNLLLSSNNFSGTIPLWMKNMKTLEYLDLSSNSFSRVEEGKIMGILGHLCKLKTIDVSYNSIIGSIGTNHNFSNCVTYDLEILQFGSNMIGGTLPSWLGNFQNLRLLDISHNRIEGSIPVSIGSLSYLESLDLSHNNFTSIPTSIENLSSLESLDLSQNSLNGTIPESLGQCKPLVFIDLSSNFLQGAVSESHLANLSRVEYLDLSFNPLDLNLSSNWTPPFQLHNLHMVSCKIKSQFPQWIRTQTNLRVLDLSDNMMSGELLDCFSSTSLSEINVSHNHFTGLIPYFSSTMLLSIDLSFNSISGPLVHPSVEKVGNSFCNFPSLIFLGLQKNKFSGSIPDCWGKSPLGAIDLSYNELSGNIPMSLGLISSLEFLNLNNNALEGHIPLSLNNCTALALLDLSENKLSGKIPNWGAKYYSGLMILRLRANQFEGVIPQQLCTLLYLQILDLAHNNLIGNIPRCLGDIAGMESAINPFGHYGKINYEVAIPVENTMVVLKGEELDYSTILEFVVNLDLSCNNLSGTIPLELTNLSRLIGLNLSHNHLTGNIPKKIGDMGSLESLDLSNNNLSGTIPTSISALTSMVRLNLSYNKLHGQIPTGHQLQVIEDPSMAYIGNPGLCGDPLPKCNPSHAENQPTQGNTNQDNEENWGKPLLYFVIFSGFATGFWGIVGSLLLKRRFRFTLFELVDNVTDYLYVQVMIRINRQRN